eukprot:m.677157 g.677157  ORF g.677157 m.677157 type:complete len:267 (-) comp22794_c0_seq4:254-1054(-)
MSPSQVWIGSSLLGRDCHGTYMRYEAIPDISNFENQFSDLHTVQDVADRYAEDPGFFDQLRSPTECYMAPDVESGVIYRDQQDCVVWQVSKDDGKVRTDDGLTVASSIAEFFLRVFIENKIWFKTNESRFARDSAGRLFKDNSDWDALANELRSDWEFTAMECDYVHFYWHTYQQAAQQLSAAGFKQWGDILPETFSPGAGAGFAHTNLSQTLLRSLCTLAEAGQLVWKKSFWGSSWLAQEAKDYAVAHNIFIGAEGQIDPNPDNE